MIIITTILLIIVILVILVIIISIMITDFYFQVSGFLVRRWLAGPSRSAGVGRDFLGEAWNGSF